MSLIPPDQIFTKLASGTAFQATAAEATLTTQTGLLTSASSNFFSDLPGDVTFPTVLPQFSNLAQTSSITALGTQMSAASDGLTTFGAHIDTQLTALPQNLNIFASHNAFKGLIDCNSKVVQFFGSILDGAKILLQTVGNIFKAITTGIAAVLAGAGTVLSYIQNQLAAALATVQATLGAALAAVTNFIAAEVAALSSAINDLINNATALLFGGLFRDLCVAQVMQNPSVANPLGAGAGLVV